MTTLQQSADNAVTTWGPPSYNLVDRLIGVGLSEGDCIKEIVIIIWLLHITSKMGSIESTGCQQEEPLLCIYAANLHIHINFDE